MLNIDKNDPIEQLRQLANRFEADFTEDHNSARMEFDNDRGKGYIATYKVFPGLVANTYNIRLTEQLKFSEDELGLAPTYFIYCLNGHYLHKFKKDDSYQKIHYNQNVILSGGENIGHDMILPAEINLKISIIFLSSKRLKDVGGKRARRLDLAMQKLVERFTTKEKENYYEDIDPESAEFAEVLIHNKRLDALGIIITEGAILNTLASQLYNHERHKASGVFRNISKNELNKIIALGDYIKENLHGKISVNELRIESGLSVKKLQVGFNYLYGESVSHMMQRLRMERAQQLLNSSELSISEVCYQVGITSRSYFSKLFKEHFGMVPSEYRMQLDAPNVVFELTYKSLAKADLTITELDDILKTSKQHNDKMNITGALVYYEGIFFQLIEGKKRDIMDLYDRIIQDYRHRQVELIYTGVKSKRSFPNWSMAHIGDKKIVNALQMDGNLSFVDLKPILQDMDSYEMFSDILWRRVATILKTSAHKNADILT